MKGRLVSFLLFPSDGKARMVPPEPDFSSLLGGAQNRLTTPAAPLNANCHKK